MLNIKMKGRAVLHTSDLTPKEISDIRGRGEIGPLPHSAAEYSFIYGGLQVARGDIIKKKGRYFFRVRKVDV
jgi:hypothetical protein